jgi:hypothetical protein
MASASATSASVGKTTGMMALANEFVMDDDRPVIVTGFGILKQAKADIFHLGIEALRNDKNWKKK